MINAGRLIQNVTTIGPTSTSASSATIPTDITNVLITNPIILEIRLDANDSKNFAI